QVLRRRYQAPLGADWTLGAPGNTGAALEAAVAVGAATDLLEECWWSPGFLAPDGTAGFHLSERGLPGGIIVNAAGVRFADESLPYDQLGRAMVQAHASSGVSHVPCWFVTDQAFIDRYGLAGIRRGTTEPDPAWFDAGILERAGTVAELAVAIGVPDDALVATVTEWNASCASGTDSAFGRGENAYDRFFGDASRGSNPNMGPIEAGPYYALQVVPADLGTKGGLRCDPHARVLRKDGEAIPGLYAAGNTMAAWSRHAYPGPGTPIGSCLAFAYLAVTDILRQ
ncbi:MAG: FAD-binding protein, partial [Actinomycetota bacterium]|nr:FAD-binding protein [Actinomycetota bacterium]